ncbi:MAG TPA: zf-HC2 domain-containing protein [Bacteroidota bacterium]|nr:zf-HC2 domain-containing protein [Bacteroidota bacterium]
MDHPSEHTIELYVLGAPLESSERRQVEEHLKGCKGCRELLESVSSYYADLQVDVLTHPPVRSGPSPNLPVQSRRWPAIFEPPFREAPLSRVPSAGALRRFVRLHPFVTGGGGLALLGGLAFLMLTFNLMPVRDLNIVTVIENQNQSTLDAYNRRGEKLWSLPVPRLSDYVHIEQTTSRTFLQVADLDGDGKNEVITSLPLTQEEAALGDYGDVLRILGPDRSVIRTIRPGETITCRGRSYPDDFRISGFSIGDFSGTGNDEIVVLMNHLHSPSVISRYDASGRRLGTYRHFGQLNMMGTRPIVSGAKNILVLIGASDNREGEYVAVVVGIDPSRITGDGESSYSGGFGLPHSAAESFYVWIRESGMARAFGSHMRLSNARPLPLKGEGGFRVGAVGVPDSISIYLEYIFRPDFSIAEVKSENQTKERFQMLASKGRVKGDFFDHYMKVVAGEVRYWDGDRWQSRLTPVLH